MLYGYIYIQAYRRYKYLYATLAYHINTCEGTNLMYPSWTTLAHWGRVTHICVSDLIIIGLDNGLLPGRCQAIIWTNAVILLIGHLGTNFSAILIEIITLSFKKMHLKVSSVKWRQFCLCLNVLKMGLNTLKPQQNGETVLQIFEGIFKCKS